MSALTLAVKAYLEQYQVHKKKLLLMVSGGVDSMVLLTVFSRIFPVKQLHVLHINHGTRADNKNDAALVQSYCKSLNIAYTMETIAENPSRNKELFWRNTRDAIAKTVSKSVGAQKIITAHHATDLVETTIFRLIKGSGIMGLSPFDLSRKPLYSISKEAILNYAHEQNIPYNTDSSNQDLNFERNKIRHLVLPQLRTITPNLESVFVRNAQVYENYKEFISKQIQCSSKSIQISDLLAMPKLLQAELLLQIATKPPSGDEIADCLRWLKNNPKGNTKKQIGGTNLLYANKLLSWD